MILFLGESIMIINKVLIQKLHGYYDYNINLNEDITFIYGSNGCGKTTVLNIISSIVTGKLFNLFEFSFDKIELIYSSKKNTFQTDKIVISKKDVLNVFFNGKKYVIEDISNLNERLSTSADIGDFERNFFDKYPVTKEISCTFNYVYLPLNRSCMDNYSQDYFYFNRRHYYSPYRATPGSTYNSYLNESLNYIADIIRDRCALISSIENRINAKFHHKVLISSIDITYDLQVLKLFKELENTSWDDILQKKESYIKTLKEVNEWNENLQNKIDKYFREFKNSFNSYTNSLKTSNNLGVGLDLIFKYAEFIKIRKIADLAKEMEELKEKARKPKEDFLKIINDFLSSSGKIIEITNEGKVLFKQPSYKNRRPLTLNDLSSGEKQLVIIFASLVFGLQGNKSGIYIVDEPEASLHLAWQNKFVKSILSVNNNIQLIFATHSPELIGKYRDKTVKLIRNDEGILDHE